MNLVRDYPASTADLHGDLNQPNNRHVEETRTATSPRRPIPMAHFGGPQAALYGQIVQGVAAASAFDVTAEQTVSGKRPFTTLANGDTISYIAISLDDPNDWEAGVMTYVSASKTFTRSDANVHYSSNSGSRVNFLKSDSSGANVMLLGKDSSAYLNAWTISAPGATRTFAGSETTAATIAAALALLINDLKAAGVVA